MNAKKIMGAVLVALLAAALFIGAGAAAVADANGKVVFVNQKLDANTYGVNWIGSNGAVTPSPSDVVGQVYFPAGSEGVYTYEPSAGTKYTLTVKSPEVVASAVAGTGAYAYKFLNGIYYLESGSVVVNIATAATGGESTADIKVFVTLPNGQETTPASGQTIQDFFTALLVTNTNPAIGEYIVNVQFPVGAFVNGTLVNEMAAKPVSFKVAEAGDVSISASADQVLRTDSVKITITGQPGFVYDVTYDEGAFEPVEQGQKSLYGGIYQSEITTVPGKEGFKFKMPNTGKIDIVMVSTNAADDSEEITVANGDDDASVTIAFKTGTITAKTEAEAYFVGNVVKISGTTTAGKIDYMEIAGTNFFANLTGGSAESFTGAVDKLVYNADNTFSFELKTSLIENAKMEGKMLDVGTYTLTLNTGSAKATATIVLKQPFITIVSAPEVLVQGTDAEFVINAEATNQIRYYIFGTNYYYNNTANADSKVKNQFKIKLDGDDIIAKMDAGQYFMVIQHKMYDDMFNIYPEGTTIMLKEEEGATPAKLFNIDVRQTANAAQALCDNLDSQTIDDMYVKYSFIVAGKDAAFTINEIPEEVVKGTTFTVSGTSTAAAGKYVTVEMISTAFAAVPKDTVGSAAFIVLTTQVADDGTWEVTFDTSDLNVDEYSVKVASEGTTWKSVNINVVAAADEPETPVTPEQPEQPEQPEEPVAPATPGFGALAALAGLGAVAVLLLRRE